MSEYRLPEFEERVADYKRSVMGESDDLETRFRQACIDQGLPDDCSVDGFVRHFIGQSEAVNGMCRVAYEKMDERIAEAVAAAVEAERRRLGMNDPEWRQLGIYLNHLLDGVGGPAINHWRHMVERVALECES